MRVEGPPPEFGFVLHEALVSGWNQRLERRLDLDKEALSEKATREDPCTASCPSAEPGFSEEADDAQLHRVDRAVQVISELRPRLGHCGALRAFWRKASALPVSAHCRSRSSPWAQKNKEILPLLFLKVAKKAGFAGNIRGTSNLEHQLLQLQPPQAGVLCLTTPQFRMPRDLTTDLTTVRNTLMPGSRHLQRHPLRVTAPQPRQVWRLDLRFSAGFKV